MKRQSYSFLKEVENAKDGQATEVATMLDSYQKDGFAADSLVNSVLKYNDKDL
jgi:hypothetical protein